jgi:hypothetical protein
MFASLRERPLIQKAALLFGYGLLTFIAIYLAGNQVLANPLLFRLFELFWFIHIVYICNRVQQTQRELLTLALIALSPGIINNFLGLLRP